MVDQNSGKEEFTLIKAFLGGLTSKLQIKNGNDILCTTEFQDANFKV